MIGIILAGGAATRMGGGDKGLLEVGGRPILDRVIDVMRVQCTTLLISANGDPGRFARFGYPVVEDDGSERRGPLAGVLAALDHLASGTPDATFAVTAPTDTPFLPSDLVARLEAARHAAGADIACARSSGHIHPVAALWAVSLRHDLRKALDGERLRKAGAFLERHRYAIADWPDVPHDPFYNVNTPADLISAEAILSATAGEERLADSPRVRL